MSKLIPEKSIAKYHLRNILLVLSFLINSTISFSQVDSTKKEMKFDLGITRDQNINLWPVFKRTISEIETDKQLLFPIYRSYHNLKTGEKRSHILPIYWRDSSRVDWNLRLLSSYYPSVVHLSINSLENTKTFTLLELAPRINVLEFKKSPDGLVLQNNLLFFLWYKENKITKKSHLVIFPTYWQFASLERKTKTFFPLYSYGSYAKYTKNYYAITPLFWHFKAPKRNSNLLFPIWWNRTIITSNDSVRNNLIFPIYYSHTDKSTRNNVVFPVVWSLKNNRYRSFTIPPLVSFGKGINTSRSHLMLTPIFWKFKRDEGQSITLFPLIWQNSWKTKFDNYRSLVIFPIYWSSKDNDISSTVVLPFIWNKTTPNYQSFSFIPLLSTGHSPDGTLRHLAITPFYWHVHSNLGYSNLLFPIWFYKKTITDKTVRTSNVVFPLYWSWKNQLENGNILFPILWSFKNPNYGSFTLIPFVSIGNSTDRSTGYKAVTPFYWYFKTLDGSGRLLFPLWFEKQTTEAGEVKSSSKVVLLYWKYKDLERKHQGVFPVAWRFKKDNKSSFTFFPFYSVGKNNATNKSYLALTPAFWQFKSSQRTLNILFPIWWNTKNYSSQNVKHFNLVLPLYYSYYDTIKTPRVLFPIVWRFKNPLYSSFTFFPVVSFGKTPDNRIHHLTITPLFWNVRNLNGHSTTLLPIFWHSKSGDGELATMRTILFPIYFETKDDDVQNRIIFPIAWSLNNSTYSSLTIAPLFSYGRNSDNSSSHYAITPFYYNIKRSNSSSRILFPLWWDLKKTSKNNYYHRNVLFPIYWFAQSQNKVTKVLFPIVWSFRSAQSRSFTFIPVFSNGQSRSGLSHLMVTPLFWKFSDGSMCRTILFPLFTNYRDSSDNRKFDILFFLFRRSKTDDKKGFSIIWPIIEGSTTSSYKYFRIAPLVWSKRSKEFNYFTIQPLYYQSWSNNHSTYRFLWELYVHKSQVGIKKTNSILWQLATWDRYSNGDKDFRILYLLYANSKVNGRVEKSLFPIYYLTKDDNGNKSLSVMLYFYNSLKRKIPNTPEFYQEERIFWLIRIRSNYRILKQKGIEME